MTTRWKTWFFLFLFLAAHGLAGAQAPRRSRATAAPPVDFFPLAVGNTWTYTTVGAQTSDSLTIEVTFADQFNGRTYFQLEGYAPATAWVRRTESGQLVEWDAEAKRERLWYEFQAPEGSFWRPEIPDECLGTATIASRRAAVNVPIGDFQGALQIDFGPASCADAGIQSEFFAPNVGLVQRTVLTIAGPRAYALSHAEIAGQTHGGPALTLSLSLDQPAYRADRMPPVDPDRATPTMRVSIMIRNTTDVPLTLTMASGLQFDVILRNDAGGVVYQWSEGKVFTQALTTLDLSPGQRTFSLDIPLVTTAGQPLPPGHYVAEAWLATVNTDAYRASLPFEVLEPVF